MNITTLVLDSVSTTDGGGTEFVFTPRSRVGYRAGQAGLLIVPGGGAKPFTFSSDARSGQLSVATTLHSGTRFKKALGAMEPGSRVRAAAAIGSLPRLVPSVSQVLVAQGIGITPFLSYARTFESMNATLLQVGKPLWFDETAAAMTDAEHHDHRDTLGDAFQRATVARPDAQWSVSGNSAFINAIAKDLRAAGVSARQIHKAAFWTMRTPAQADPSVTGAAA